MNIRSREVELPYYVKLALVLLSLVIIIYGLHTLEGLLLPLVFAILFAVLLFPLVERLEGWRVPRILAIILCLILALGVVTALFWVFRTRSAILPKLFLNLSSVPTNT